MARKRIAGMILKVLRGAINFIVLAAFLLMFMAGIYVQWDSRQMLRQAESVSYEMYRPADVAHLSFTELTEQNPDVFAWLTIDDTKVDYPVAQGRDNEYYVNTDVLGNFSLSGSIFLDYRNARDFSDPVSILHGHHMAEDVMFGGFDRFGDRDYFAAHRSGSLFFDEKKYALEIFAFLHADAYDTAVYNPRVEKDEKAEFVRLLQDSAEQFVEEVDLTRPIVLMSTCEYSETNGRMILAATIGGEIEPETYAESPNQGRCRLILAGCLLAAGIAVLILVLRKRRKAKENHSVKESEHTRATGSHPPRSSVPGADNTENRVGKLSDDDPGTRGSSRQPSLGAEVLMLLVKLAAIAGVFVLIFTFVFGLQISTDEAMSPAVKYRDLSFYYRLDRKPDARDLVIYVDPSGKKRIGRVVAVGGDSVDVTGDGLRINGYLQQEEYVNGETLAYQDGVTYPVTLSSGEYFVLGDCRTQSVDSRLFGAIPESRIKGRVVAFIRHQNF